jgi:hypothetical protein
MVDQFPTWLMEEGAILQAMGRERALGHPGTALWGFVGGCLQQFFALT